MSEYNRWAMGSAANSNVTVLTYQDKTIHLIGTAHVSQKSVTEVTRLIHDIRPDTVCVELDRSRYDALTDPRRFRQLDVFEIIRSKRISFTLGSLVLTSYQRRMGAKLGVIPGAELLAGVNAAGDVGAQLVLADRDVQVTLKRSWAKLGFSDRAQLLVAMVVSLFASSSEVSEEQIEALKDRDTIAEMMTELAKHMPNLQVPLIDERDRYLMSTIQESPGPVVVGVVGAGHIGGMIRYLGQNVDRAALNTLPPPSRYAPVRPWIAPLVFVSVVAFGWLQLGAALAESMVLHWLLLVGGSVGVATFLSGATLATAAGSSLLAPLTTLVPVIQSSSAAAWLEASRRKPTERDKEQINEALLSLGAMRANPFVRILFVGAAAGFASAVAAWAATAWALLTLLLHV
jgi:pheromone shutdown-related protein TraB